MLPPFSNLSHDLVLQIADLLWEEEDVKNPWAPVTDCMSSGEQAVYNLSRTSTSLYKLLSPYLFQCITLRNTKSSGQAVQYLRSTSQIANIKTLRFKCQLGGGARDFDDIESILPSEITGVLSDLAQFPLLATLIIDFVALDDMWDFDNGVLGMVAEVESKEEIEEAEEWNRSRAIVKKTLKAISTTCSDSVRDEEFDKWLGKLESFKFEVHARYINGRHIHITPRFQSYIENLDHYFFDAIGNVTRLGIIGRLDAVIGHVYREALVPLKTTHLVKLKELELGYYIIQDDLLDFLVARSSTLEHLIFNKCFRNCSEYPKSENEPQGTWKSWFHIYASEEPHALQCVTFIPYGASVAPDYRSSDLDSSIRKNQVHTEQKWEGKEPRIFPYGMFRDTWGHFTPEPNMVTPRTREGDLEG